MKRGFILAILSLSIFITFSGFVIPEKSYAAQSCSAGQVFISDYEGGGSCVKDPNCPAGQHYASNFNGGVICIKDPTPEEKEQMENLLKTKKKSDANELIEAAKKNGVTLTDAQINALPWSLSTGFGKEGEILASGKAAGTTINAKAPSATQPVIGNNDSTNTCSFDNPGACIVNGFDWFIRNTVLQIGTWALTMGSFLLDASINYGIIHFSEWVPPGITSLWKLVRDILYLCIVFIGFYLAFMYIIGKDDKFKKFIPKLIIFALFVNFSLPISKAMIDMSNIVALNIYNSALSGLPSGGTSIMDKIGLNTLLTENAAKQGSNLPATLLSIIFVFFATWVFFQVAILMLVRTAVLTLCLIGSPLLLIDATVTIPTFGERIKKVRSLFFNQLFMADVFMIMFFITLQVMVVLKQGMLAINDSTGLSAPPQLGNVSLIFGIFMMLALLYFMMKITKSMSGEVGELATGFVNGGVGLLAGGAMGGTAMIGRAGIGRFAARTLAERGEGTLGGWINRNQDKLGGRMAYGLTNSLANSTFDTRNSGVAQKFSAKTGISLGKGGALGYKQTLDNTIKDKTERMNRIDTSTKDGREAKERFQKNAGGVLGLAVDKNEVKKSLEKNRKSESEKSLSEYAKLEGQEKQEYFNKQDNKTKEVLLKSDISEARKDVEKAEDRELRKKGIDYQGMIAKAMTEKNEIEKGKLTSQPKPNELIKDFAESIKNKMNANSHIPAPPENKNNLSNSLHTSRGGHTDETTTSGGIIIPKSASV